MPTSRVRVTRLVCATLTLVSSTLYAQEATLKVSHFLPPNSNDQKGVLEPWCDKLAKDSSGKLKCQIYPAMQLGGTPPQLADQVKNAVADIVMTSPSYASGRFPYTEALEQPFTLPPGSLAGSKAMWEYSQKYATKDYADVQAAGHVHRQRHHHEHVQQADPDRLDERSRPGGARHGGAPAAHRRRRAHHLAHFAGRGRRLLVG